MLHAAMPLYYVRTPQVAYCTSRNAYEDGLRPQFEVPYDLLVVAVGERPATFGVAGVEEHCYFMKASREGPFGHAPHCSWRSRRSWCSHGAAGAAGAQLVQPVPVAQQQPEKP